MLLRKLGEGDTKNEEKKLANVWIESSGGGATAAAAAVYT